MKLNKIIIIFFLFAVFIAMSCTSGDNQEEELIPISQLKRQHRQEMMIYNRELTKTDKVVIERFIDRRRWDMTMSETGLFYQIYENGEGKKVKEHKYVEFEYTTSLLDGTLLYNSEVYGNRLMQIGRNQDERGLDEGLRLMRAGDRARFILHPFLAFGVPGDGYKVPINAILLYDVKIVDVRNTPDKE